MNPMILREPITISIEHGIITEIDEKKGKNEPRSRFIEDIISEFLAKSVSKEKNPEEISPQVNNRKIQSRKREEIS